MNQYYEIDLSKSNLNIDLLYEIYNFDYEFHQIINTIETNYSFNEIKLLFNDFFIIIFRNFEKLFFIKSPKKKIFNIAFQNLKTYSFLVPSIHSNINGIYKKKILPKLRASNIEHTFFSSYVSEYTLENESNETCLRWISKDLIFDKIIEIYLTKFKIKNYYEKRGY